MSAPAIVFWLAAWVGHGSIVIAVLTRMYGLALPKLVLEATRKVLVLAILAFPLLALWLAETRALTVYAWICVAVATALLPMATLWRGLEAARGRRGVTGEVITVDYYAELGPAVYGDGRMTWATRLPFTDAFKVDFTRLSVRLDGLPTALDGLEIVLLTDLHFHGTPSSAFFEAVFDRLALEPPPDLVLFGGDTVDSDDHRAWIAPLVSRLSATAGRFAVLGNHDTSHGPEEIREEFRRAGFTMLGRADNGGVANLTIRGEPVTVVGNEWPWFPWPDTDKVPAAGFKIVLSHTPDRFLWAARRGYDLVLAGHVHGGQIRLPVIGPIFVPSVFGRRYDTGVFRRGKCALVVCRGLSGKEPLRVRCRPEVVRLRLVAG